MFFRLLGERAFLNLSIRGKNMSVFKNIKGRVVAAKAAVVAAAGAASGAALAEVDTTKVQSALTAAQTSAEGVGGMVIAVVAGLVVVGVIIALVRKV